MALPEVVNLKAGGGCDVYIGRPSKWGNPFVVGRDGSREDVIERYRQELWRKINSGAISPDDLQELAGRRLGCFCAPEACHGDVLKEAWEIVCGDAA